MTIAKLAETCETKFWLLLIPILDAQGPLTKVMDFIKGIVKTKPGFLSFLFLIWAAVGFMLGLVLGRMLWIIQAL